jgi:3-deoxy-manno-octulosonate cytidylyltransferase (CMP-KDO synthetase)
VVASGEHDDRKGIRAAMKVLAVIPARYASTRLPGKPLVPLAGKPMIQRVWEQVRRARAVGEVVVATDDERIRKTVEGFGGEAVMTRGDHRSGTERIAEVAVARSDAEFFVDVQGDEPLIEPAAIDAAVEALGSDDAVSVATLAVPITNPADIMDPNVVKAVVDFDGNALYFSRAPIPWVRDREGPVHARHLKHLGLYAFRRDALLEFPTFPQGDLERVEQLEQLRWLENGYRIRVAETEYDSASVDTPEDLSRVEQLLAGKANPA